ncbi:uncharacterized protein LOC136077015 isoform X1 [Hydra vulgaris]|uniref:Uncharacterized protein LOC136077015 isoform X1 n=1 Tax=Hydra vulgaris TaxID=6087 RepID=A0ABM4BEE3_HYDVU
MDSNKTLNFESSFYDFFRTNDFLLDEESDPDLNYFTDSDALQNKCNYFYTHEIKGFLDQNNINTIHNSIRSLKIFFEIFSNFIEETSNLFNIICLTETWCSLDDVNSFTNFELPGFSAISLARNANNRGGGVLIYVKNSLQYFTRHDRSITDADKEVLTIEILTNKIKNKILSFCYRQPSGKTKNFNSFLCNDVIKKSNRENKFIYLLGDLNLDCFQYHVNNNIKKFYNGILENGAIPLISKPTRITQSSVSLIDNILTTDVFNVSLKKGIIKNDISDHFHVFFFINIDNKLLPNEKRVFKKRIFINKNLESFKEQLSLIDWNFINASANTNLVYNSFFKTFYDIYDTNFPEVNLKLKAKSIKSPWITKGLRKSSKIKQKLYINYLKCKTNENKIIYKNYAKLFERLKKKKKKKNII